VTKAFLDTTVLTDALFKTGNQGRVACDAIAKYRTVLVSRYALKEFKAGPIRAYAWFHNKVTGAATFGEAVRAIQSVRRHKNLASTAIEALAEFHSSIGKIRSTSLLDQYPRDTHDEIMKKEAKAYLRTKVLMAWRAVRREPYQATHPLSCFAEVGPSLNDDGTLEYKPLMCTLGECCLPRQFAEQKTATLALRDVCAQLEGKPEMRKRRKVLDRIIRSPTTSINESECRALGDAVFALQCPVEAAILTTNISDHEPLAKAVGKSIVRPG
jgi:hypothetical protein